MFGWNVSQSSLYSAVAVNVHLRYKKFRRQELQFRNWNKALGRDLSVLGDLSELGIHSDAVSLLCPSSHFNFCGVAVHILEDEGRRGLCAFRAVPSQRGRNFFRCMHLSFFQSSWAARRKWALLSTSNDDNDDDCNSVVLSPTAINLPGEHNEWQLVFFHAASEWVSEWVRGFTVHMHVYVRAREGKRWPFRPGFLTHYLAFIFFSPFLLSSNYRSNDNATYFQSTSNCFFFPSTHSLTGVITICDKAQKLKKKECFVFLWHSEIKSFKR